MFKELLETLSYLVVLSHSLADVLPDNLFNNLSELRLEVVNSICCLVYAFLHLHPKIFNELGLAVEVLNCHIVFLDLRF